MEDENKNENVGTQTTPGAQNDEQNGNKNEGEKAKKSVAKKGEDGSIVFKNQDELDGFISRMYAKGAKENQNKNVSDNTDKNQATPKKEQEENTQQEQNQVAQQNADYLSTKVALAMAKAGVNAEKVERAARLVDTSKIMVNGIINTTKLEEEINAVIAEFPELKNTKEEEKEEKGFKFGGAQGDSNDNSNKKRPIATKKWNRFN